MKYFVFTYGNVEDESSISIYENQQSVQQHISACNLDGCLSDVYDENDLWKMRSDAMKYRFLKQNNGVELTGTLSERGIT